MQTTTETVKEFRLFFVHRSTAQMYHELRLKHPLVGAAAILRWARDIVGFRRKHENFPALNGVTDKYVQHTYRGITFSTKVDCDDDVNGRETGKFSDEKKSPWSIKNMDAWNEKKYQGHTHLLMWWNPRDDLDVKFKYWRNKPYCLSKTVAHEKTLALARAMYNQACNSEFYFLVVKVYLDGIKLGDASLGGLDRSQIDGEDSKIELLGVFTEAVHESKKTLTKITKAAAGFRRAARRF